MTAAAKLPQVGRVVPNAPWPVVPLGELAADERNAITDGPFGSKLKSEHYTAAGPRVIRLTNIGDAEFVDAKAHISEAHFATLQKHRVYPGDIVIAALGENPPRSCLVPESVGPAIVKADCIRFKAGPRILPKFLNYVLNGPSLRRHAKAIVHGVGRPRLNLGEIKALPIPVPPLPDQRRIVAEIEKQFTRLDAGVAALRRTQANLKRYRAAVLKAACEGRLVPTEAELAKQQSSKRGSVPCDKVQPSIPIRSTSYETGEQLLARILTERRKKWNGRGKYKEPIAPEHHVGFELPQGWTWTGFDQIADGTKHAIKAGPFGSSLKKSFYTASGFKIYGQEQVIKGDAHFGDYFISQDLFEELQSCEVKPGDILISLVGTTGKVLILPDDCAPGIINPRLLKLSLNRAGVSSKFIKILLESATTRAFFKLAAHGGTMEILNLGILKTLPIALPPLAEQTRIVAEVERRLSVVEELETAVNADLQRATRLRQSVLAASFQSSTH